jgi:cation transport regulator ChaC
MLSIFGYGSLIFAPECEDALIARQPARLPGHRRSFNKRSISRLCPRGESFDAFPESDPAFLRDGVYRSLVLGTDPDPVVAMEGMLLQYADRDRDQVLAATDRREGYDAKRASRKNGYLRRTCRALGLDRGEALSCEVYLSNPDPACIYRVPPELDLLSRARILINATPRRGRGPSGSGGLHYLEGVRASLRGVGIIDPELEALAAAVRSLPGPWVELVAPARPG